MLPQAGGTGAAVAITVFYPLNNLRTRCDAHDATRPPTSPTLCHGRMQVSDGEQKGMVQARHVAVPNHLTTDREELSRTLVVWFIVAISAKHRTE